MVLRRLMLVTACSSVLALAASWLAGVYVSRRFAALPKASDSAPTSAPADAHIPWSTEILTAEAPAHASSAKGRHNRKAKRSGRTLADELQRGIRRLSDRRYEITRATLDLALRNVGALSRWVRVAPDVHDGTASGFRVVFVDADGPFADLGLRAGDVLVSVNGLDIRTPDGALDAFAKLKAATRYTVGVVREGRETTTEYVIR